MNVKILMQDTKATEIKFNHIIVFISEDTMFCSQYYSTVTIPFLWSTTQQLPLKSPGIRPFFAQGPTILLNNSQGRFILGPGCPFTEFDIQDPFSVCPKADPLYQCRSDPYTLKEALCMECLQILNFYCRIPRIHFT